MDNRKGLDNRRKCPICRRRYEGTGHDGLPVWPGRVCDKCNRDYVIPMRMQLMKQIEEENEKKKGGGEAPK